LQLNVQLSGLTPPVLKKRGWKDIEKKATESPKRGKDRKRRARGFEAGGRTWEDSGEGEAIRDDHAVFS